MPSNCGVGEDSFESPLDSSKIKPVNPKGNQPWMFIGKTDAEAEAPILWPHNGQSRFTGKDWYWERERAGGEGATEHEMIGWCRWLKGHESEQTLGVKDKEAWLTAVHGVRVRQDWATEQQQQGIYALPITNILSRRMFDCTYPLSKIPCIRTSSFTALEDFLKATPEATSQAIVFSKSPNKTETYLSYLVHFIF